MDEKDYFSDSFSDEAGGIVSDERDAEELPVPESSGDEEPDGHLVEAPVIPVEEPGERDEARGRDLELFVRTYPGVRPQDVPAEVWERARRGESLVTAYMRYEAGLLRRENQRLVREAKLRNTERANRERSAGSQLGSGVGARRPDPFEDGWEDAF